MSPRLAVFAISLIARHYVGLRPSDKEKEDAKLLAAIAACDKGAAAPLDPTATAPPIQFSELFGPTSSLSRFARLPTRARSRPRADPTRSGSGSNGSGPRSRSANGSSRALTGRVAVARRARECRRRTSCSSSSTARYADAGIDLAEGQAALRAAAEAGHREALLTVVEEYRYGPYFRRDPHEAARFAALLGGAAEAGHRIDRTPATARRWPLGVLVANGLPLMSDALLAGGADSAASASIRALLREGRCRAPWCLTQRASLRSRHCGGPRQWARMLLEDAVADDNARALVILAEMLAEGEGGAGRRQAGDRAPHRARSPSRRPTRRGRCSPASISTTATPVAGRARRSASSPQAEDIDARHPRCRRCSWITTSGSTTRTDTPRRWTLRPRSASRARRWPGRG